MRQPCPCNSALLSLAFIAVAYVGLVNAAGAAAKISAGPMPGYVAMRSAVIWLQVDAPGEVVIEYWPQGRESEARSSQPHRLEAKEDYTTAVHIEGLEPSLTYEYRVRIDGAEQPFDAPLEFHTQPLWQWRGPPPDFTVAIGSCAYINDPPYDRPDPPYGGGYEIFDAIAREKPAMMLWLGDNVYLREADYLSPGGMASRYRHARSLPSLQRLLRTTHHVALWDDHDFGPNNTNGSFVFKETAAVLFKRYWANPSYGLPGVPGVFTLVTYGDAEFFLLDDRFYRNADEAPDFPGKSMLGEVQLKWLKDALAASSATFKLIANGSQMLDNQPGVEGWHNFPYERDEFLGWALKAGIRGVIFLSGDRHMTKLIRRRRVGGYPLYELTCSPLTSSPRDPKKEQLDLEVMEGMLVGSRNFCTLSFSGPHESRKVTLRAYNTAGSLLWEHHIAADALR